MTPTIPLPHVAPPRTYCGSRWVGLGSQSVVHSNPGASACIRDSAPRLDRDVAEHELISIPSELTSRSKRRRCAIDDRHDGRGGQHVAEHTRRQPQDGGKREGYQRRQDRRDRSGDSGARQPTGTRGQVAQQDSADTASGSDDRNLHVCSDSAVGSRLTDSPSGSPDCLAERPTTKAPRPVVPDPARPTSAGRPSADESCPDFSVASRRAWERDCRARPRLDAARMKPCGDSAASHRRVVRCMQLDSDG
jgi:hypothetical protein